LVILVCGFEQLAQGASGGIEPSAEEYSTAFANTPIFDRIGPLTMRTDRDLVDFIVDSDGEDKAAPALAIHATTLRIAQVLTPIIENSSHECKVCHKKLTSKSSLISHVKANHAKKTAPSGKTIITKSIVTAAATKTTKSKKIHHCSHCDKVFTESGNLSRHKRVHSGKKPYQCTQCDKAFSRVDVLKKHERVHTGEKPHRCTQCNKAFPRSDSLRVHVRIHTGERPFKCTHSGCGKAFTQSSHLKPHKKVHSGEKPFRCIQCDKAFATSGSLKVHEKIHSKKI
jgi:uncharacterized Zn-finger protein